MKSLIRWTLVLGIGLTAATPALADLKVATSLTDLAAVAEIRRQEARDSSEPLPGIRRPALRPGQSRA
jgi:hypothetical protein